MSEPQFATWLSQMLEARRMSPSELAAHLGMNSLGIRLWLGGHSTPQREACEQISRLFNVGAGDVLRLAGW